MSTLHTSSIDTVKRHNQSKSVSPAMRTDTGSTSRCGLSAYPQPRNSTSKSVPLKAQRLKELASAAKDAPMASAGTSASCLPEITEDASIQLAAEAQKTLIGPMPVRSFYREFLPPMRKGDAMPDTRGAFDSVPLNANEERDVCLPLIEAIEKGRRCPSVRIFNTASKLRRSGQKPVNPDITGYSLADMRHLNQGKDGRIVANLGLAEILFQVRLDHDPFCDHHHHKTQSKGQSRQTFLAYENHATWYDKDARREMRNFGQMVAFVTEACARQHRTFFFSVMIVGTRARLLRWDRAGVIVTESFDYRQKPKLLCEFLWRFHLATPIQRGFDPTISTATTQEELLFRRIISEEIVFQLGFDVNNKAELETALKVHYQEGKVKRIEVHKTNQLWPEIYLVSVPVKSPSSAFGSATRGYWSVRLVGLGRGEVAFMKDTWCMEVPTVTDEGSVYEEMRGKVSNIPELSIHGFVPGDESNDFVEHRGCSKACLGDDGSHASKTQCTRTQDFVNEDWVCECLRVNHMNDEEDLPYRVVKYTHYRLVLKEVGYLLATFSGSLELFEAARDALEALSTAYEMCGRLHRDVSLGNIILARCRNTRRRRGLLIDWQLSTKTDESGRAKDRNRFGTWAFMSGCALDVSETDFRHGREDDLESLFYVVVYGSLRWLPHNEMGNLGVWMHNFFDYCTTSNGRNTGGIVKQNHAIVSGERFNRLFKFDEPLLQLWFKQAYEYLGTNSIIRKDRGLPLQWTAENLRKLFEAVCQGLSNVEGATKDRCEHDVERFRPTSGRFPHDLWDCSTCASTINSSDSGSTCTSDSIRTPHTNSSHAESAVGMNVGATHRNKKRMLADVDDCESDLDNHESSFGSFRPTKRARVNRQLQCGVRIKETVRQPPRRTGHSPTRQSLRHRVAPCGSQVNSGSGNVSRKGSNPPRVRTPGTASTERSGEVVGLRRSARLATKTCSSNLKTKVNNKVV